MILLTSASISINQNPHKVFDFATNMENYADWFEGIINIASSNTLSQFSLGKCYQETLVINGEEQQLTIKVDQCLRPQLFITKGDLAGILPQMTMKFTDINRGLETEPNTTSTLMELSYHSREPSLESNQAMLDFLRQNLSQRAEAGLKKLKGLLEETEKEFNH